MLRSFYVFISHLYFLVYKLPIFLLSCVLSSEFVEILYAFVLLTLCWFCALQILSLAYDYFFVNLRVCSWAWWCTPIIR